MIGIRADLHDMQDTLDFAVTKTLNHEKKLRSS